MVDLGTSSTRGSEANGTKWLIWESFEKYRMDFLVWRPANAQKVVQVLAAKSEFVLPMPDPTNRRARRAELCLQMSRSRLSVNRFH
jgi:hypothetical protein